MPWDLKHCHATASTKCTHGIETRECLLSTGYEPFSVDNGTIWFRKFVEVEAPKQIEGPRVEEQEEFKPSALDYMLVDDSPLDMERAQLVRGRRPLNRPQSDTTRAAEGLVVE